MNILFGSPTSKVDVAVVTEFIPLATVERSLAVM